MPPHEFNLGGNVASHVRKSSFAELRIGGLGTSHSSVGREVPNSMTVKEAADIPYARVDGVVPVARALHVD